MNDIFFHSLLFALAGVLIFIFGGILVSATDRLARHLHQDGFITAFILLGILTSLSEFSVAVNSTLEKTPQISAGNLIGASFVIFFFIIPFLAMAGGGFTTHKTLNKKLLALALFVIGAPALFLFDGALMPHEGGILIALYLILAYYTKKIRVRGIGEALQDMRVAKSNLRADVAKVILAAIVIFVSGRFLVTETIFFSQALRITPSFIGLIIISIGTNLPELVVGIRAIMARKKSIAFGDYVGSAAFNTLLLGLLSIWNGEFKMHTNEFLLTTIFLFTGLLLFYFFARSKNFISRKEGFILFLVYVLFVATQFFLASRATTVF